MREKYCSSAEKVRLISQANMTYKGNDSCLGIRAGMASRWHAYLPKCSLLDIYCVCVQFGYTRTRVVLGISIKYESNSVS